MAVYNFSALSDGQSLAFSASADRLNFDQTTIAGGDLTLAAEGSGVRVTVKSGPQAGKDVLLTGFTLEQIAATNFSFADGSFARVGDNNVGTAGDGAANVLSGGVGRDLLMGLGGNDNLQAGDGNDSLVGGTGNDTLSGNNGNDWLNGSAGNDTLNGGGGQDAFILSDMGAANADLLADFGTSWDNVQLDAAAFTQIGAAGRFAAGDARFRAGTAAQDADDRIIYNSATGQILYDADGNGAGAAQLIGTLGAGRSVTATDFWVFGEAGGGGGGGINGTAGDDSLVGTENDDSINGLGGNDTLDGIAGGDRLDGGTGNDSLMGGSGSDVLIGGEGHDTLDGEGGSEDVFPPSKVAVDTLDGGLGNDTYITSTGDQVLDAGGIDTVIAVDADWTLAAGFENLTLVQDDSDGGKRGFGNDLANVIRGHWGDDLLDGGAGNDTIFGNGGDDTFRLSLGSGNYGQDYLDGGEFSDEQDLLDFSDARSAFTADLQAGTLVGGGTGGSGSATLVSIESVIGGEFNDRIVASSSSFWESLLFGGGGNDTLQGSATNDFLVGGAGNDFITGGAGDDVITIHHAEFGRLPAFFGDYGTDTVDGGAGSDQLNFSDFGVFAASGANIDLSTGRATGGGPGGSGLVLFTNIENADGTNQADQITGDAGANNLNGNDGADTIDGGAGNDLLHGGFSFNDADVFLFRHFGDANADAIGNFEPGLEKLSFDQSVFTALGPGGNFSAGDERFHAAAGATSGHDATDRLVYDTSTGRLFYDADGNGAGASQLVVTVFGLRATDIVAGPVNNQTINGTPGNDNLAGGAGADTINGLGGNDSLAGNDGNDSLDGGAGNDTLDGGAGRDAMVGGPGDDLYFVDNAFDTVVELENGGIDEVRSSISYRLTDWVNNLTLVGGDAFSGEGNAIANVVTGNALGNTLRGWQDNDTLIGGDGFDHLIGGAGNDSMLGGNDGDSFWMSEFGGTSYGNDTLDGGSDQDTVRFDNARSAVIVNMAAGTATGGGEGGAGSATLINVEHAVGSSFNDQFIGDGGTNSFNGGAGNDTFEGGGEFDVFMGGDGADVFVFGAPVPLNTVANDLVNDFATGVDTVQLNATLMPALGASGRFAADDARFYAAAGVNSGHDADDRIIYNTSTGQIYYDADGSGAGASQLVGQLNVPGSPVFPPAPFAASDIVVINGSSGGGGGTTINGTPGNDSLVGGTGNDTINGNAGNDTLRGNGGDDSLDGGSGSDLLDGGLGNDFYVVTTGDSLIDAGGNDTVVALNSWALGSGFENLILATSAVDGSGNSGANRIEGNAANNVLRGRDGNDTVTGGGGSDFFDFTTAPSAANADTITDFATVDQLRFEDAAFTAIGATGTWSASDGRFWASTAGTAHDANDRVVYNTTTGALYYDADGSGAGAAVLVATLQGAPTVSASDITVI